MKKFSNITIMLLTISFFVLSFYIIVFGTIARKNNDLLNFFGYSYARVSTETNSMSGDNIDSFESGSFIITKKVKYQNIKEGDIVVFSRGQILVVHRVIEITEEGFITKGDNNPSTDAGFVTLDNYKGKVTKSFMLFSFGESIDSYQLLILALMILALTIFLIKQIINLIKMIFNERAEKIKTTNEEKLRQEILLEIGENYEK